MFEDQYVELLPARTTMKACKPKKRGGCYNYHGGNNTGGAGGSGGAGGAGGDGGNNNTAIAVNVALLNNGDVTQTATANAGNGGAGGAGGDGGDGGRAS